MKMQRQKRFKWGGFFLVVGLSSLTGTGCWRGDTVERYLKEGSFFEQRSRYADAARVYQTALQRYPEAAVVYQRLGYAYQYLGQFAQAEEAYLRAIDCDHVLLDAYVNLAALYYNEGWIHRAIALLQEARAIDAAAYYVNLTLGYLMYEVGKSDESISDLRRAIKARPEEPLPYYNLGAIYFMQGDLETASEMLTLTTDRAQTFADAYELLALIAEKQDHIDEAVRYWKKYADYGDKRSQKTRYATDRWHELLRRQLQ